MEHPLCSRIRARNLRHAVFDFEPRLQTPVLEHFLNEELLAAIAARSLSDSEVLSAVAEKCFAESDLLGDLGGAYLAMGDVLCRLAAPEEARVA